MRSSDLTYLEKQLEERLRAKDKRKRKRMSVSGKSVFNLQKILRDKRENT